MRSNWVPAAIVCFAIAGIASGCRSSGGGFSNPLAGMFGGNKAATAEGGSTVVPGSEYAQQSGAPDVQLPSAQATPYGHGPSMGPAATGNQYAGQYGAYPAAGGAAYNAMNGGAGAAGAGAYGEMSYADAAQQYQGGGYPLASQTGGPAMQANPYAAESMAPQQGAYGQSATPYGSYGATAGAAPPYGATSPAAGAAPPYGASPYGAPGASPEVMVGEAEASQAPMMGSSRYAADTTTGATGDSRYSVASRYDTPGSASSGPTPNPYATNTPGYPAPASSQAGAYPSTPSDGVVPSATSRYPESAASSAGAYPATSAAPVTASTYPSTPPAGTVYPSSPETYGAPAASAPASSYRPGGTTDYAPVSPSTGSGIAPGGYGAMRTGVTPASYDQSPSTIVRYGEKPCADGSCQDCQSCPPQMAAPAMGMGGESLSVVTPPEVAMPAAGSQL